MGNTLRDRRAVTDWASISQAIEIADKIGSFEGLVGIISADLAALDSDLLPKGWRDNDVLGTLQFGFGDTGKNVPTLKGQVAVKVPAVCQRCLEPFSLTLRIAPRLLLLAADESVEGLDDYEIWELQEQLLQPADIVEELLIMALPFAPMHDKIEECKVLASMVVETDADNVEEMKNPFATLRSRMKQNEQDPTS